MSYHIISGEEKEALSRKGFRQPPKVVAPTHSTMKMQLIASLAYYYIRSGLFELATIANFIGAIADSI